MKNAIFILLALSVAGTAHAQSVSDQLDQAQQYIEQKGDEAKQAVEQNNPFTGNQDDKSGPGQITIHPNFERNDTSR